MPGPAPRVALTGGTGFLGRYAVAAFLKAGWRVRLLTRRDPTHPQLPGLDAEIVFGDLTDSHALRQFSADADAIVHIAGAIKARSRTEFFRTNESGSAALGAAVAEVAPEARLLMVSSLAAREPTLSEYAASKRAGEAALQEAAGRGATILRPGAIHGPWDMETLVLFKLASRPVMPVPALPAGRLSFVEASDVARAIVALATASSPPATYELSDARTDGYGWMELSRAAAEAVGRRPRVLPVPRTVWPVAGAAVETLARLSGTAPMMSRGKVREMLHADWSSSAEHQPPAELWRPYVDLAAGFRRSVKWARERGHLSGGIR